MGGRQANCGFRWTKMRPDSSRCIRGGDTVFLSWPLQWSGLFVGRQGHFLGAFLPLIQILGSIWSHQQAQSSALSNTSAHSPRWPHCGAGIVFQRSFTELPQACSGPFHPQCCARYQWGNSTQRKLQKRESCRTQTVKAWKAHTHCSLIFSGGGELIHSSKAFFSGFIFAFILWAYSDIIQSSVGLMSLLNECHR